MRFRWVWIFTAIIVLIADSSRADDFYKGKTIRVIVGGSAGGGFDIYTRAMARHMGKHIPGNPAMIVENMTGAGTLIAAKYLHSSAKPDGLSFGIFNGGVDPERRTRQQEHRLRHERTGISRRAGAGQHRVRPTQGKRRY